MPGQRTSAPASVNRMSRESSNDHIVRYLTATGDDSSSRNVLGNYSSPHIVFLQPPVGTVYLMKTVVVFIRDNGAHEISDYGGDVGGISPGWALRLQDDSGTLHNFVHYNVLDNAYFGMINGPLGRQGTRLGLDTGWLTTSDFQLAKGGALLRVDGSLNQRIEVIIEGNYSTLQVHTFLAYGYVE